MRVHTKSPAHKSSAGSIVTGGVAGDLSVEIVPIAQLRPYTRNARQHSKRQIGQIAASIEKFGLNNPVLIDEAGQIIAGHGRVAAATQLGLSKVPVVRLSHLSEVEKRTYI